MKERIPKLKSDQKSYEKILKDAGMPGRIRNEKVPIIPISNSEAIFMSVPTVKSSTIEKFISLSEEMQTAIVHDIEKKVKEGMKEVDILVRLDNLIAGGESFDLHNESDSDKNHKPLLKISHQGSERREAEGFAAGFGDRLIDQVEEAKPEVKKTNFIN